MADAPPILAAGAILWDVLARAPGQIARGGDLPGHVRRAPGGVATGVARALARAGARVRLLGAVGAGAEGDALLACLAAEEIDISAVLRPDGAGIDSYVGVEDDDGLVAAVAETTTLEAAGAAVLAPVLSGTAPAGALIVDGNLPRAALAALQTSRALPPLRLVPASPARAAALLALARRPGAMLHCNRAEAEAMLGRATTDAPEAALALRGLGVSRALVTDGARAAALIDARSMHVRTPPPARPARVTGAGDAALAGHLLAELAGAGPERALEAALAAALAHLTEGDPA